MRKLLFMATLLAVATACPKVERKVYTFDLKQNKGVLYFENIVTDAPESADSDFMEIVNKVIRGTKVEEENPGWTVAEKKLYENEGRLDGKMEFSFANASGAGLYKHDKKAPYIWCASRDEEETIVATNGQRIAELPGCVAWERKAKELSVTVRSATMTGGEKPLLDSFTRWSNGEELKVEANPFGNLGGGSDDVDGLAEAFAAGLGSGMADGIAGDAELTVGPVKVDGGDEEAAKKAFGGMQEAGLKICIADGAAKKLEFSEKLVLAVKPDGSYTMKVEGDATDEERTKCYTEALKELKLPAAKKAWTLMFPLGVDQP